MRVPALALLVCLAACGGGDDDATPDANPDPGACATWTLEDRAITGIALIDPAGVTDQRTVRVSITVPLGPCEELAIGDAVFASGAPDVLLTARAWVRHGDGCSGPAQTVHRPVTLRLPEATTWSIRAPGGIPPVSVPVSAFPADDCSPSRQPCKADCDCDLAAGERCLGYDSGGIVGPTTRCARPCEVDRDCGAACSGEDPADEAEVPWSCTDAAECSDTRPCPLGWSCDAGACTPDFTLSQSTRGECTCDADCSAGLRCVTPADATQPARCQAACATDGAWCQGAHTCGTIDEDVSGLAGTDSVCGFLGE